MLKAICKTDYKRVLKAQEHISSNPSFKKAVYLDRIEDRHLDPQDIKGLSFHEVYGVWFDRELSSLLRDSVPCDSRIVFLNEKPDKIGPGIHEVSVANKQACLYFWRAQGYPRGVIVLSGNEDGNKKAAEIFQQAPWDWTGVLKI